MLGLISQVKRKLLVAKTIPVLAAQIRLRLVAVGSDGGQRWPDSSSSLENTRTPQQPLNNRGCFEEGAAVGLKTLGLFDAKQETVAGELLAETPLSQVHGSRRQSRVLQGALLLNSSCMCEARTIGCDTTDRRTDVVHFRFRCATTSSAPVLNFVRDLFTCFSYNCKEKFVLRNSN